MAGFNRALAKIRVWTVVALSVGAVVLLAIKKAVGQLVELTTF